MCCTRPTGCMPRAVRHRRRIVNKPKRLSSWLNTRTGRLFQEGQVGLTPDTDKGGEFIWRSPLALCGLSARFLAVVSMGNGLADADVQPPHVYNHLPVVHPVDSLQGDHKITSVLDIDDECVGIWHVTAHGAELLAAFGRINLEANLNGAMLWHVGPSWMELLEDSRERPSRAGRRRIGWCGYDRR